MIIELIGPNGESVSVIFDETNPNHTNPKSVICDTDNPLLDQIAFSVIPNDLTYSKANNPIEALSFFREHGYEAVSEEKDWLDIGEPAYQIVS